MVEIAASRPTAALSSQKDQPVRVTGAEAHETQPQPTSSGGATPPRHVAVIMDGNGRWATQRGLPRVAGHRAGVEAVRRLVKAAAKRGIGYLTIFSFSTENWARPAEEVGELMRLLRLFIRADLAKLHEQNIRIRIVGEREGLPADLLAMLDEAESLTRGNTSLTLVVAFNYGARQEMLRAIRSLAADAAAGKLDPAAIDIGHVSARLDTADIPDPDLIIRTSGEQRISNFLLWQVAYTEFLFLPILWPDFDDAHLDEALGEFARRTRRFGGL
jgi:undecaprenyl diphosphate synthase